MADQLVESLARPFEPKEFENEHKRELLALIERKLSGEEMPVVAEPAPAEPVPDLMAALKASIDQAKDATPSAGAPNGGSDADVEAQGRSRRPRRRRTAKANGKAPAKSRAKAGAGAKGGNGSGG